MIAEMTPVALLLCAAGVFLGGFVKGYSGFGQAAVTMALATLVLAPAEVVPIAVVLEIAISLGLLRSMLAKVDLRLLALLMAGAALGSPVGAALLAVMPADTMRIVVLLAILAASFALLMRARLAFATGGVSIALAGLISGVVNGATALGGLPIVLFLTARGSDATSLRATMFTYLFASSVYLGGWLIWQGLLDETALRRSAVLLPVIVLGFWLGTRRFVSASPESFRQFVLQLLIVLAAIGLARAALL